MDNRCSTHIQGGTLRKGFRNIPQDIYMILHHFVVSIRRMNRMDSDYKDRQLQLVHVQSRYTVQMDHRYSRSHSNTLLCDLLHDKVHYCHKVQDMGPRSDYFDKHCLTNIPSLSHIRDDNLVVDRRSFQGKSTMAIRPQVGSDYSAHMVMVDMG